VTVSPSSASVLLGLTQQFSASVAGTTNATVIWSVNNITGGNTAVGTVDSQGRYVAPGDLPASTTVVITATSQADNTKSATAQVVLTSDVAVSISPPAAHAELGAMQRFSAAVSSAGRPDTSVRWSLSGAACPLACGSIDSSGNYTAPQILPGTPEVTVVATSAADTSKQASAALQLTSSFTLALSGPANLATGTSAQITATITPVPGSNPSPSVTWSLSGAGCSGPACGVLTPSSPVPSTNGAFATQAAYSAPALAPDPQSVTITAAAVADPSKTASLSVSLIQIVSVALAPLSAVRAVNQTLSLSVQVSGSANTTVAWSVNGVPGGNALAGQICAVGSSPCQVITSSSASQVAYLAPGAIPSANPVIVQAVSQADPTKTSSAQITVVSHVVVSVIPASLTLAPGATQPFSASVLGSSDQNVTWQVQGAACASQPCGSIDVNGLYTAPSAAPSPNSVQVVATSAEDTSQSGSANVAIACGPSILEILPASVYAGAASGFTLEVQGSGFAPSSPGPGSVLLVGGSARTTSCASANECTAAITPSDVASPEQLTVQVQNPDNSSSNQVALVVVAPSSMDQVISLSVSAPSAAGQDIVVVEPTTAGVSTVESNVDLDVAALGPFSVATNSCALAGNPVVLARPASGASTADVCVFSSSGLDPSMNYSVSGPGDVSVLSRQPAGLGIIHLTLQVSSTAAPGPRTLFIENANKDKAAASGAFEVQ